MAKNNQLVDLNVARTFIEAYWRNDPLLRQIALNLLDKLPRVDDKEVVRCKDCEFCHYNSSADTYKCTSMNGMYRTVKENDFCSYGERRADE